MVLAVRLPSRSAAALRGVLLAAATGERGGDPPVVIAGVAADRRTGVAALALLVAVWLVAVLRSCRCAVVRIVRRLLTPVTCGF